jgi:hypothetical protein
MLAASRDDCIAASLSRGARSSVHFHAHALYHICRITHTYTIAHTPHLSVTHRTWYLTTSFPHTSHLLLTRNTHRSHITPIAHTPHLFLTRHIYRRSHVTSIVHTPQLHDMHAPPCRTSATSALPTCCPFSLPRWTPWPTRYSSSSLALDSSAA